MQNLVIGALVVAALALAAFVIWPGKGLLAVWRRNRDLRERALREDALKHIQKTEQKGQWASMQSVAGMLGVSVNQAANLLAELETHGLISLKAGEIHLSEAGREYALQVMRAHRLYEKFLADKTGYDQAKWHEMAEEREHALTPEDADALAAELGHPRYDPHGDPIPTAKGEVVLHGGMPLASLEVGQTARIVHVGDEPEAIAERLGKEKLSPGMKVHIAESTTEEVQFWADDEKHSLPLLVASQVEVVPVKEKATAVEIKGESLGALKRGERGRVVQLSPRCRGPERRRLMDLGILPGTEIEAELVSPSGDPTAYRVRGAVVALRKEQSELIRVERI